METLQSSVYAMATGFCLLFYWLTKRHFSKVSLHFFCTFLLIQAFSFFFEWCFHQPDVPLRWMWLGLMMGLALLSAPCLWLYAQESLENVRPAFAVLGAADKCFVIVGLIFLLPLTLLPLFEGHHSAIKTLAVNSIHETMLISIAIYLIQVPYYLKKCIGILNVQARLSRAIFADIQDMPLNILRVLIWVVLGDWSLNLFRTLLVMLTDGPSILYVLITLGDAGLICWALLTISSAALRFDAFQKTHQALKTQRKYANYAMSPSDLARVEDKIEKAMAHDKLYTNNALSLMSLSEHIKEPQHYISQTINQNLQSSFYELINQYRIEAAKTQLVDKPSAAVIDIALEVGYNAKSTFNAAFKRSTGMTPSEYRVSVKTAS